MNFLSDEKYLPYIYRARTGKKIDIENPKTFNEKLQWLKINDRRKIYTIMVDKFEAKNYVSTIIGSEYIIPTIGVWNTFDEIDFNDLPTEFVLKCTHDSGGLFICRNKSELDIDNAKKVINNSMKTNYYYKSPREWPYKNVKRKIIAENYMQDGENVFLKDYKFYCFNGEPKFLYVSEGMEDHSKAKISFLTLDWEFARFSRRDYSSFTELPKKPLNFDLMIEICKQLSKDIPFIRVDLYEINKKVYFSELTFYPASGFMPFNPPEADAEVGKLLDLDVF